MASGLPQWGRDRAQVLWLSTGFESHPEGNPIYCRLYVLLIQASWLLNFHYHRWKFNATDEDHRLQNVLHLFVRTFTIFHRDHFILKFPPVQIIVVWKDPSMVFRHKIFKTCLQSSGINDKWINDTLWNIDISFSLRLTLQRTLRAFSALKNPNMMLMFVTFISLRAESGEPEKLVGSTSWPPLNWRTMSLNVEMKSSANCRENFPT